MENSVFLPAQMLLPSPTCNWEKWAVLACDQFTSEPEYWQQVEEAVGDSPSTLRMIVPEVYLEQEGLQERITSVHTYMKKALDIQLTQKAEGFIYVERQMQNGSIRQGLIGCVDLEEYSYKKGEICRIKPSEATVEERIPPRLAVRKGALVESPHILMLIDDSEQQVIEPIGKKKAQLEKLYSFSLMLDGGKISAWKVNEKTDINNIVKNLSLLEERDRFEDLYKIKDGQQPFAMIVGDGNHSLATAKALWEETKATLSVEKQKNHPARYCLVEVENIQSEAIEIEPIHRVFFNVDREDFLQAAKEYAVTKKSELIEGKEDEKYFTLCDKEEKTPYSLISSEYPLVAGFFEDFFAEYKVSHPKAQIDYVHGDSSVRDLVGKGAVGILLPPIEKSDLFKGVALGGVLPRKTFSMGHAKEKRYYLECRKIMDEC